MSTDTFWTFLSALNLCVPSWKMFPRATRTPTAIVDDDVCGSDRTNKQVVADDVFYRHSPKLSFFVLCHKRSELPPVKGNEVSLPLSWMDTLSGTNSDDNDDVSTSEVMLEAPVTPQSIPTGDVHKNMYNIVQSIHDAAAELERRQLIDGSTSSSTHVVTTRPKHKGEKRNARTDDNKKKDFFELKMPHEIMKLIHR